MARKGMVRAAALALFAAVSVAGVAHALPYQHTYYSTKANIRYSYHMHWNGCYRHEDYDRTDYTRHYDANGIYQYTTSVGPYAAMEESWWDVWC